MLNKIILFLNNILISLNNVLISVQHYQECKDTIKNKYYLDSYYESCCEKTYKLMIGSKKIGS